MKLENSENKRRPDSLRLELIQSYSKFNFYSAASTKEIALALSKIMCIPVNKWLP